MQKQKGFSTLAIVLIIVGMVIIIVGGVFAFQFSSKKIQLVSQNNQIVSKNLSDEKIKVDLSGIRVFSADYSIKNNYSYKGFCTSDYMNKMAAEINFSCYDSADSWAASSKMNDNVNYFCVDSRGIAKLVTTNSSSTTCPSN